MVSQQNLRNTTRELGENLVKVPINRLDSFSLSLWTNPPNKDPRAIRVFGMVVQVLNQAVSIFEAGNASQAELLRNELGAVLQGSN